MAARKFIVAQLSSPISAHNLGNCKTNYPMEPQQLNRMCGCMGLVPQEHHKKYSKMPKWQLRFLERRQERMVHDPY